MGDEPPDALIAVDFFTSQELQPERLCKGLIAAADVMAIGDGDEIAIDY
jgi:hypothetical protein